MAWRFFGFAGGGRTARSVTGAFFVAGLMLSTSLSVAQENPVAVEAGQDSLFSARVLTSGLSNPWEMVWGPDDLLWVTERSSGEVTRVDPYTGAQQTILTLADFSVDVQHQGLLGMALHPELLEGTGNDYVYIAYTYETGTEDAPDPKARLERYTYDANNEQLIDPVVLIEGVPAGNDHNAGRVKFGPDGKLYYSLGEQGANFGGNFRRPNHAQLLPTQDQVDVEDWEAYSGKILRLELNGSIPADNPEIEGVRSHIFSYGHRNPQGIDFGPDGTLYEAEHGPDTDDELNIIVAGGNYGWPNIAGYRDELSYIYADWSQAPEGQRYTGRAGIPDTVPQFPESEFEGEIVEPLTTYWTVGNEYDFTANCGWICNPTIAPAALMYYEAGEDGIAEWDRSVLLPTLKHGVLYVQHLSEDGQAVDGLPTAWFSTQNRYRDVEIGPDNTVFIATDGFGTVAEKFGDTGFTNVLHNPGAILMFSYGAEEGAGDGGGLAFAPQGPATPESVAEASEEGTPELASADFDALFAQGRTLFGTTCAACHGPAGQGAQGPSLVGNADALADDDFLAGTILHGFGYMPAFSARFDDEQVASIATYIRNAWGNEFGVVTPEDVAAQR